MSKVILKITENTGIKEDKIQIPLNEETEEEEKNRCYYQ